MKNIESMNGHEFSEFINDCLNGDDEHLKRLAQETKHKYFDSRGIDIETSWFEDPDDVWDAEAHFAMYM